MLRRFGTVSHISRLALVFSIPICGLAEVHLACNASVAVTPTLRSEGFTELTGDIVLNCSGGTPTPAGSPVPTAGITVSLNTGLTSRTFGTNPTGSVSEALLLIDEPASGSEKLQPANAQAEGNGTGIDYNAVGNVVQGVQAGSNSVTFSFPWDPISTGHRTLRFTNIRANASGLVGGSASGFGPVIAHVTSSGGALSIDLSEVVGNVEPSFSASLSSPPATVPGCNGATSLPPQNFTILTFKELFNSAFKTRATVNPTTGAPQPQDSPGVVYGNESGYYSSQLSTPGASNLAGLADFGTRLKAVFSNIPQGVSVYVSATDLTSGSAPNAALTKDETGAFSAEPGTGTAIAQGSGYPIAEVNATNGSATVVWEVVNPSSGGLSFAFWFTVQPNTTPTGTQPVTVTLSYAPQFTAPAGSPIPQFSAASPVLALPVLAVSDCTQTNPSLFTSVTALNPTGTAGSVVPITQTVDVISPGPSLTFSYTPQTSSGGNWLTVNPSAKQTPAALTVSIKPAGLPAGTYNGNITLSSQPASGPPSSLLIPVQLIVAGDTPVIKTGGVVSAATEQAGPVSPGEVLALYGSKLGPTSLVKLSVVNNQVWTETGNAQVLFDGTPAPVIYARDGQTSAIVPYAVAGKATTQVQVFYNGILGAPVTLEVAPTNPGIFTLNGSGTGPGAIFNHDFTRNSPSNPAKPSSTIILYVTGEGQTNPPGQDGKFTVAPEPTPLGQVSVKIGGMPAQTRYAAEAPSLVSGVLQVNVVVPSGLPSGTNSVDVTVGNNSSPSGVTVQVQ